MERKTHTHTHTHTHKTWDDLQHNNQISVYTCVHVHIQYLDPQDTMLLWGVPSHQPLQQCMYSKTHNTTTTVIQSIASQHVRASKVLYMYPPPTHQAHTHTHTHTHLHACIPACGVKPLDTNEQIIDLLQHKACTHCKTLGTNNNYA